MDCIVLREPGRLEYQQVELNANLDADDALLKVHRVGICGTDMHAFRGKQPFFSYPRVLGHELGVEVIDIGKDVTNVKVGDRCAIEPYFNRTEDQAVKRGKTNCGENISVFGVHEDGGMKEFIKLPAKYLHSSPTLGYDELALVEPLAIGCHAVNRAEVHSDDLVLVIGAGPIGLAVIQFATLKKAKVVVMDVNEDRLAFCKKAMGVAGTIDASSTDLIIEKIREIFDGCLPTIVMDATGNPQSMKNTLDYIAFGGRIVFVGLYQGDFTFFDPLFHKKEITLLASRNALSQDFKEIISIMEKGQINTASWITHKIEKVNLVDLFENLLRPESKVIKALIEF